MSYLAEAHSEWHAVHGKYAICPLDCGAAEALMDPTDYFTEQELADEAALAEHDLFAQW